MTKTYLDSRSRPYADTRNYYEVTGCEGKTDEEIKAFIDYKTEDEVPNFCCPFCENYQRVSDGKATYTLVVPFLD